METFFDQVLKINLGNELERKFLGLVKDDYLNATEFDFYFNDKKRIEYYNNYFFNDLQDNLLKYIKEFNDRELFIYFRKQIDYSIKYNPTNKYKVLKESYGVFYSGPYSEEPVYYDIEGYELDVFNHNFELYKNKIYPEFENILKDTYDQYQNGKISTNKEEITNIILDHRPIFVIDDKVDLTMIRRKGREMTDYDQHVIALLFTYLRDNKAILDFNNESLAKLISHLTLTSKNRLLKETITEMDYVRNGICNINKYSGDPLKLLGNLRNLISDIFIMIEEDIRKIENR
ncbi:MAG: hypothetical protein RBT49_05635 [Bacteroidales bacterium]|jgi:hypothetical protein|nr:hypothetical protein [Bacteroidales bacterium]